MLNQPILTEKSFRQAGSGVFTFKAQLHATKSAIIAEVEKLFNVHVEKVTSTIKKGGIKRSGRRRLPSAKIPTKTVRVWLKKGENISLFDIQKD